MPAPTANQMDAAIAALKQKAEHKDPAITVEHVLISFTGCGVPNVTRSKEEAHKLATEIHGRAIAGEDFSALRKTYSEDTGGGVYPMTVQSRSRMVKGFGDVGWRLQVGEIGVADHHVTASPYGWHIIKRVK